MNDLVGEKCTPEQEKLYWVRWHNLLDFRAKRDLTETEQVEYNGYLAIVARLDAEEEALSVEAIKRLAEQHRRVLASIRRLTEAVESKCDG